MKNTKVNGSPIESPVNKETPAWASRSTGAGFGGFDSLIGMEAKSRPQSVAAGAVDPEEFEDAQGILGFLNRRIAKKEEPFKLPVGTIAPKAVWETEQPKLDPPAASAPTMATDDILKNIVPPVEGQELPLIKPSSMNPVSKTYKTASATFYNGLDDKFGSTTAKPNSKGKFEAIEGETVAVDGKEVPFGKWIEVMYGDGTTKRFYTHDTGSAVKKKTASKGRGNNQPVLDFYTAGKDLKGKNSKVGNNVRYRILDDSEI